jgi:hypothetical protein
LEGGDLDLFKGIIPVLGWKDKKASEISVNI